jgi:enterochelin esterase family protein
MKIRYIVTAACLAAWAFAQAPAPVGPQGRGRGGRGPQGPVVVSPVVSPDRHVTFRILAPQAQKVELRASDIIELAQTPAQFTRNAEGVWEATAGPIGPGAYRYTFVVDGVAVMDPRNPLVSESNNNAWSLVYVPGADFMDETKVPHGAVAAVHYYSTALGKFRRMHVYTPPGYENNQKKYPVFYLLHGSGDCDEAWTSVGRAGFILDNLIAAGKAKPMIVAMPAGHTSAATFGGRGAAAAGAAAAPARDEFYEDFTTDAMPYIEKHYRVLAGRPNRAIAGLSMGGSQTLNVAFRNLGKFAYVGVFSSGATGMDGGTDWEKNHAADLDNASLKKGLKLLWFSTGVEDELMDRSTKPTVEMLKKHGFNVMFQESPGAHTWINWRNYLNDFAPQLFR